MGQTRMSPRHSTTITTCLPQIPPRKFGKLGFELDETPQHYLPIFVVLVPVDLPPPPEDLSGTRKNMKGRGKFCVRAFQRSSILSEFDDPHCKQRYAMIQTEGRYDIEISNNRNTCIFTVPVKSMDSLFFIF